MRQIARERSDTDRSGLKRVRSKPEENRADRSGTGPVNRSLDHVIGVRIPASQPRNLPCVFNNLQHRVISL
jgi:hypothetical protein